LALRFADPMVQTIWNALLLFDLLPAGFSNRDLRTNLAALYGQPVDQFTQDRMTYQLRRLRPHLPDRTYSQDPLLSSHQLWIPRRRLLHQHLRQDLATRSWSSPAGYVLDPMSVTTQFR
jgi:hypothetical protein